MLANWVRIPPPGTLSPTAATFAIWLPVARKIPSVALLRRIVE